MVLICTFLMTQGVVSLFIDHLDMVFCSMPVHFFIYIKKYVYIYIHTYL